MKKPRMRQRVQAAMKSVKSGSLYKHQVTLYLLHFSSWATCHTLKHPVDKDAA